MNICIENEEFIFEREWRIRKVFRRERTELELKDKGFYLGRKWIKIFFLRWKERLWLESESVLEVWKLVCVCFRFFCELGGTVIFWGDLEFEKRNMELEVSLWEVGEVVDRRLVEGLLCGFDSLGEVGKWVIWVLRFLLVTFVM